jgi:HPt (histidine-containing phosphotransfer) domain-containing protein
VDRTVLDTLRQLPGGKRLVDRLIRMYLEDSPGRMEAMRGAVARVDAVAVARAAHTFTSSSGNVGAFGLAALCRVMEDAGRENSLGGARALLAEIEVEFDAVVADLAARLEAAES